MNDFNTLKEECRKTAKTVSGIQNGIDLHEDLHKSLSLILKAIKSLHESSNIDANKILELAEKPAPKKRKQKSK